jgi:hypothetical protein
MILDQRNSHVPGNRLSDTKQLDGKLRELRFHLGEFAVRITYRIATVRRIVLLTVFHKTRTEPRRPSCIKTTHGSTRMLISARRSLELA